MNSERWRQIQDIYLDAADRPDSERAAFVKHACGDDSELRAEVESLLQADASEDSLLDSTLDDLLDFLAEEEDSAEDAEAPDRAGPYLLLEEIGRGGMGRVYRAERDDDQYRREVAVKIVVAAGSDPADLAARFRRERQILAGLEHPNIGRLYDAGVADDGRPWLAMELVRGEPIHQHCDRLRLTVPQRLALFSQVCAGVDYAHRNLVVHRDLKPSNILVTGEGRVKLLDFGIAKLLSEAEPAAAEEEPLTRSETRVFTPEYASPEQLRGDTLTTASDVYGLGILLHQLLTGRRPLRREGIDSLSGTPSMSVTGGTERESDTATSDEIAGARRTTPKRLRRLLHGELDTILLKALRPDLADRYSSVVALMEDIERYQEGRPIEARPPSVAYRLRKFTARNGVAVGAAMLALTALVIGLGAALVQARVAGEERDVALAVAGFLEGLFSAADPWQQEGIRTDTMRVRDFLPPAVERLDTAFIDQPEVRARMQHVLGTVHQDLGMTDEARELLSAALEGYRSLDGPVNERAANVLREIGRLGANTGEPGESVAAYREALDIRTALRGSDPQETATVQSELASALIELDSLAGAERLLTEAIAVRRSAAGPSSAVANDLNILGVLRYRQGRIDEAIPVMREALDMNREVLGPDHPATAVMTQNLGFLLNRLRRYEEAVPLLEEAERSLTAALGSDYPPLAQVVGSLAIAYEGLDRWPEADSLFSEALQRLRRSADPGRRDFAIALHDYAGALMRHGDLDRAEPLAREAIGVERGLSGPDGVGTGVTTGLLAEVLRRSGALAEAESLYGESLRILQATFPETHPRVLGVRSGVALTMGQRGRWEAAEPLLLEVHEQAGDVADGGVAARSAAEALMRFYEARGDSAQAARWRGAMN